jgi:hypothetical protein
MEEDEAKSFLENVPAFEAALRGGGPLQARLAAGFKPVQEDLIKEIQKIMQAGGVDQLAAARAKGLITVESVKPATTADLIEGVVITTKRFERGEPGEPSQTDRMVEVFTSKLSDHLASGREYLIFDEQIADLARAGIEAGIFTPAPGPAGRGAQAMTASGLMGRLPTFPDATVDEILDIRDELAPALTRFRGEMVTLSKTFTSPAWEEGFADEVHDAWAESVHPAIDAIDESVRENKSLLNAAAGITGTLKTAAPGLAVLGAGAVGHSPPMTIAGSVVSATGPLLEALREHKATATRIKMQPFYFLHSLKRALPGD